MINQKKWMKRPSFYGRKHKFFVILPILFFLSLTLMMGSVRGYDYNDSFGTIDKICSKDNEYILFIMSSEYKPFDAKLTIDFEYIDIKDGDLRASFNTIDESNVSYEFHIEFKKGDSGNIMDSYSETNGNVFISQNYVESSGSYYADFTEIFGKSTTLINLIDLSSFSEDLYDNYFYNGYSEISDHTFNTKQEFLNFMEDKSIFGYIFSNTTGIEITNTYLEAYGVPQNSPILLIILSIEVSILSLYGIRRYRKRKV